MSDSSSDLSSRSPPSTNRARPGFTRPSAFGNPIERGSIKGCRLGGTCLNLAIVCAARIRVAGPTRVSCFGVGGPTRATRLAVRRQGEDPASEGILVASSAVRSLLRNTHLVSDEGRTPGIQGSKVCTTIRQTRRCSPPGPRHSSWSSWDDAVTYGLSPCPPTRTDARAAALYNPRTPRRVSAPAA
jgi:hypothetical protein